MKKLVVLLALSFVLIAVVLGMLLREGISLRSAPIIRPSPTQDNPQLVANSVVRRLFPDFQTADYVLWGIPPDDEKLWPLLSLIQQEYENLFSQKVTLIRKENSLVNCPRPCWVLLNPEDAHELNDQSFALANVTPLHKVHFSITLVPFQRHMEVPEECLQEKRLSFKCLVPLSVHESLRKMKKEDLKYFFMRKYQDRDYFLFVENP